jgi:hypothetical protein
MYLHIGNNKNLRSRSVVGIFDSDTATVSAATKDFLKRKQKADKLLSSSAELPKSFLLTESGEVWLSQLSTSALLGRSRNRSV